LVRYFLFISGGRTLFSSHYSSEADSLKNFIGNLDRQLIQQARDVVTDTTMDELMREEPYGPAAYRDAIRQQILALLTRLRISLYIMDKLMALANSLMPGKDNLDE
jgi:hypothetical protein